MAHKKNRLYSIVKFIAVLTARLCFRVKIIGSENYPKEGAFLLLSNHQSWFDPILCTMSTKRELCFMARDTLFKHKHFGRFITKLNAIPLKRGESDIAAMRSILAHLDQGYSVCLYPEGTRTLDGRIADVKAGFSLLSRRGDVPVVPVVIDGMYEAWPKGRRVPVFGKRLIVKVGQPIQPEEIKAMGDRDFTTHLTGIMRKMQSEIRPLCERQPYDYAVKQPTD